MSLLKPNNFTYLANVVTTFTFHYVTIKTQSTFICGGYVAKFTFHYVTIKTIRDSYRKYLCEHLHSTMSLLKLVKLSCVTFVELIYIPLCHY